MHLTNTIEIIMLTIFKIEIDFLRCKDEKLEIGNLCMTTMTLIDGDRQ